MRRVEVYLEGPTGWAGWRRPLVVKEGPTEVILMDTATLRRLTMRRSEFVALRPRPIPCNNTFVRNAIAQAESTLPKPERGWRVQAVENMRAFARYVQANIGPSGRPRKRFF